MNDDGFDIDENNISEISWYSLFQVPFYALPSEFGSYNARLNPGVMLVADQYATPGYGFFHEIEDLGDPLEILQGIKPVISGVIADTSQSKMQEAFNNYPNCVVSVKNKAEDYLYEKDYQIKDRVIYTKANYEYVKIKTYVSVTEASKVFWDKFKINLQTLRLFNAAYSASMMDNLIERDYLNKKLRENYFGLKAEDKSFFIDDKIWFYFDNKYQHQIKWYISLFDFMHLTALFHTLQARTKEVKILKPESKCAIMIKDSTTFNLMYFDDGNIEPCYNQELKIDEVGINNIKEYILKLSRLRDELSSKETQKQALTSNIINTNEDNFKEIDKQIQEVEEQKKELQKSMLQLYHDVTVKLARKKEEILALPSQLKQVDIRAQESDDKLKGKKLTRSANNLQNILPLMSALPARVKTDVSVRNNSVIITRPNSPTSSAEYELIIPEENEDKEFNLEYLLRAGSKLFKDLNCEWIIPVGYVGLCHLYGANKKYGSKEFLDTMPADFWKTISPNVAEKIRKLGLRDILDNKRADDPLKLNPIKLYDALISVLRGIKFSYTDPKTGEEKKILGLIEAVSIPARNAYEWKFSTRLEEIIIKQNQYMICNHEAMFSYKGKILHTAPALQLYIEGLIRNNVFKGLFTSKNSCLVTPDHDGMTLERIAYRIGLFSSKDLREKDLVKKLFSALDACAEVNGGIESWERDQGQKHKKDSLKTKVTPKVPEMYELAYEANNLEKLKKDLIRRMKMPILPSSKLLF